uniref:DUF5688 family protein n=1 Tax=Acetatifactor sp. TaxID=1872090 RepID=UPI0040574271
MTYEEFKRELYHNLHLQEVSQGRQVILLEKDERFRGEDVTMMIRLINLANYGKEDSILREDTICVVWKKRGLQGMLHWYVRPIYERFKREGWQGVLPEIVCKIQQSGHQGHRLTVGSYASENDRLIIKPLNYSYYREELEDCICWRNGDIALPLHLLLYEMGEEMFSVKLDRDSIEKWDVSDEVLLTNALLNTCEKMPPRLYYDVRTRGYCVTTGRRSGGAVAFFYPGVKEQLSELLEGDYYVGFAGADEVLAYPVHHKVLSKMKTAIQRVNILCEQRDVLTDRVYRYNSNRKELIEV